MEVNAAIQRRLRRPGAHFNAHARFVEDLGADSLDMAELKLVLEETLDIAIPAEQAAEIRTVHDVLICVEKWLQVPAGSEPEREAPRCLSGARRGPQDRRVRD